MDEYEEYSGYGDSDEEYGGGYDDYSETGEYDHEHSGIKHVATYDDFLRTEKAVIDPWVEKFRICCDNDLLSGFSLDIGLLNLLKSKILCNPHPESNSEIIKDIKIQSVNPLGLTLGFFIKNNSFSEESIRKVKSLLDKSKDTIDKNLYDIVDLPSIIRYGLLWENFLMA